VADREVLEDVSEEEKDYLWEHFKFNAEQRLNARILSAAGVLLFIVAPSSRLASTRIGENCFAS
jgi:hypothetical protein